MAKSTRRRPRRMNTSANGRQGIWLRQPAFSPTVQLASAGILGETVATPLDWEREESVVTQTKKGAGSTRLERQFGEFHFQLRFTDNTQPTIPSFEVMVFEQSDQFAFLVDTNATFDGVLANNRILWYSTYPVSVSYRPSGSDNQAYMFGTSRWDVKSKARLSDRSIGLAIRLGYDTALAGTVTTTLANWVGYVTTP